MQNLERKLGTTWLFNLTVDIDADDMTGVTGQFEILRHGVQVLTAPASTEDNEVKEMLVSIHIDEQDEMVAGVHEYRFFVSKGGERVDQAEGIFYVRD